MRGWVDVHTHLDGPEFDPDRREVIERAEVAGLRWIINAATTLESCRKTLELMADFSLVRGALGIHPQEIQGDVPDFSELDQLLTEPGVVAVGEIGLDAYWDTTYLENQKKAFIEQIRLAEKHRLPVVVHSRNAHDEVLDILKSQVREVPVIWHCFSGDDRHLQKALAREYFFSVGGVLTFPKAGTLRSLVQGIPLDFLLLETDAPYLAPQTYRGRRNEPSYLVQTAQAVAKMFSLNPEALQERMYRNVLRCFPALGGDE